MRKVLFLMFLLLLIGLGAAGVKAQVRIGGNTPPNPAAALDLNADDAATPAGNKGALALPRVSLASTTAPLNGATPVTGMLVYNTNASMTGGNGVGMYFWDGSGWLRVAQIRPGSQNVFGMKMTLDTNVTVPALANMSYQVFATTSPSWPCLCEANSGGYMVSGSSSGLLVLCIGQAGCATQPAHVVCYSPAIAI